MHTDAQKLAGTLKDETTSPTHTPLHDNSCDNPLHTKKSGSPLSPAFPEVFYELWTLPPVTSPQPAPSAGQPVSPRPPYLREAVLISESRTPSGGARTASDHCSFNRARGETQ